VDYDVTSNWGNWGYVAGVGQDARGFRFFNVYKQAQDYDPHARYARHWLPELAGLAPADALRPETAATPVDYPAPMVDLYEAARANERRYERVAGPPPGQAPARRAPSRQAPSERSSRGGSARGGRR
jgi:deoxyribodipyrimidine photo-lyase